MSFSIAKFATDVTERAVSTGWQAALAFAIADDVLHNPQSAALVAVGLSVGKSLLVKFYQSNGEAQKIEKEIAPIVKEVAPAVVAADPALAPVVAVVQAVASSA